MGRSYTGLGGAVGGDTTTNEENQRIKRKEVEMRELGVGLEAVKAC